MPDSATAINPNETKADPFLGARGFVRKLIQDCCLRNNELSLSQMTNSPVTAVQKAVELVVPAIIHSLSSVVTQGNESDISKVWGQIGETNGIIIPHYSSLSCALRGQNVMEVGRSLAHSTIGQRRLKTMSNALQVTINDPEIWMHRFVLLLTPYLFGSLQRMIRLNGWQSRERLRGVFDAIRPECTAVLPETYLRQLDIALEGQDPTLDQPPEPRPRRGIIDTMFFLLSVCVMAMAMTWIFAMSLGIPIPPLEVQQVSRPTEVQHVSRPTDSEYRLR